MTNSTNHDEDSWPALTIPEDVWNPAGEMDEDPMDILYANILINGVRMVANAFRVFTDEDGYQHCYGSRDERRLEQVREALYVPGEELRTVRMFADDYVIVIEPHLAWPD